jgi:hypothetical protein
MCSVHSLVDLLQDSAVPIFKYFDEIHHIVVWQTGINLCITVKTDLRVLHPTIHAACFSRLRPSLGIKVHNVLYLIIQLFYYVF